MTETEINTKIWNIVFEIEKYAIEAAGAEQNEGVDYDWLSMQRKATVRTIRDLLKEDSKEAQTKEGDK